MFDITTVGTVAVDTFLELKDGASLITDKSDHRCYCLPLGGKLPLNNMEEHYGGNAGNTAVGFSRLGLNCAIVTSLGTCRRCMGAIYQLKQEKVETRFIALSKGCKKADLNTSYIIDWYKNKNDRTILSYHKPKDFSKIRFPKTKWIYLTSLGEYFDEVARKLPKTASIAWNPGGQEIGKGLHHLLPIFHKTAILIVNKEESARLLNVDSQTMNYGFLLDNLLKLGPTVVAITVGKDGAYAKQKGFHELHHEKGLAVKVQEVTGAGDAFAAGFVAAYIKKKNLKTALRFGILNASSCIQNTGAQNGLLTFANIKRNYKQYYKKH